MTITTRLHTFFNGQLVGEDQFGNKYYKSKRVKTGEKEKRWVIYRGLAEPSKVPPDWHGWLHYTHDNVPLTRAPKKRYAWEKSHEPNLTGTKNAYVPPGHVLRGGERDAATADYEAWRP